MNHVIDLTDLEKEKWEEIIDLAILIGKNPEKYSKACDGKLLATLFYEPSTRTQLSFQAAMLRLGGSALGFDDPQNSSVAKGETLADTIRIVSGYADCVVMRHPLEGSALVAGMFTNKVFINAGDGGHFHPTQTLADLITIKKEIGHFDNLTIGLCGDLKYGRTVHSLINLLCHYKNVSFVLISTNELKLPNQFKNIIEQSSCKYSEVLSIEEVIGSLDVLYMTRIQKERFPSEELYNSQKDTYVLDVEKLKLAKENLKVLHPLPRIDEITAEVDNDPRALYFNQAENGMWGRMALILTLFSENKIKNQLSGNLLYEKCFNEKCVTNSESYLKNSFYEVGGVLHCEYCDQPLKKTT